MEITTNLVEDLANLSKLRFEEAEKESIRKDLEKWSDLLRSWRP